MIAVVASVVHWPAASHRSPAIDLQDRIEREEELTESFTNDLLVTSPLPSRV